MSKRITFKSLTNTKKKRNEFYKFALSDISSERNAFICCALDSLFDNKIGVVPKNTTQFFSELLKFKPKNVGCLEPWFEGTNERIEVLKKCIKQTS